MRHPLLFTLLLAVGTPSRADEPNSAPRVRPTGSRIIEQNERSPNVSHQQTSASNVSRNDTQSSNVVDKEAPRDKVVSSKTPRDNLIRQEQSAPKRSRSPHEKADPLAALISGPPLVLQLATALSPTAQETPDERPLWRMLDRQLYAALLDKIDRLHAGFPDWRPPAKLVLLAREGALKQRIGQLSAASDAAGLIALAQQHPVAFSCRSILFAWSLADAHATLNQPVEAENLTRRLLDCPKEEDRLATLHKAKAWIAADRWEQLLKIEEGMARSAPGEEKFRQLRYDHRMEQLLAASDGANSAEAERLFAALAPDIGARKDSAAALLGAWNHYRLEHYALAATWFELVLAWDSTRHEAHRGLALSSLQRKRHDVALVHANALPANDAARAELLRDILVAKAQAAYGAGRHDQASTLLGTARTHAALPRHAQLLAAWSDMELGKPDAAANEFVRLYRETPDLESAQGVLNSLTRAGRDAELKQLAQAEPLSGLASRHYADHAFAGKRFLAARALAPDRYAALGAAAAPQLSVIGARRSKSGTDGLSRLTQQWEPSIEAALPLGSSRELRLRIERVRLDSGTLPNNAVVGRYPLVPAPYAFQPVTEATGWQPKLIWRDERNHAWQAELGLTPGGTVSTQWTGRLAYQDGDGKADWQWNAYREPVRESILSYTGLRDPYQGATWGRVLRNGTLANVQVRLNDHWTLNAQAAAEILSGHHVADNRRFATEAGIGYNFKFAGFDYTVLSAGITTDYYSKNLSRFTEGHGGYFSPQRYWRVGPSLDFMTEENRNFILRGRISAGRTGKREDAAPFFPLSPDGRSYAANNGTGNAYDIEFSGVWRVSAQMQAGLLAAKRHSPQYDDYATLGFIRVLLEPRQSVLSSDLPTTTGKDLF